VLDNWHRLLKRFNYTTEFDEFNSKIVHLIFPAGIVTAGRRRGGGNFGKANGMNRMAGAVVFGADRAETAGQKQGKKRRNRGAPFWLFTINRLGLSLSGHG
jgi:hypothetical protein